MLKLYLLNQFKLFENGREINDFRSQKAKALLVYLVLTDGQPVARSELQTLLWSDYTPHSAQASLRVTLSNLRQLFGHIEGLLLIERYTVYFNRSHPKFWCDLLDEQTQVEGQQMLPDLYHIGSPRFQEWLEAQQATYIANTNAIERSTNIPRALTPLFGRAEDIERLSERIVRGTTPLITIAGVGGIGKTQLALAIGRSLQDQFKDGVWFLPLTTHSASDEVGQTIAASLLELLQSAPVIQSDARQQLFDFLQSRKLLLILDNSEHLVQKPQFAVFLLQLLESAPNVHLLLTSRRRLAISAEWVYQLQQLAVPAESNLPLSHLCQFSSVELFVEKAQRVWTTFALTESNSAEIAEICRMVGGLPLGIELAAAQIVQRSPAKIVAILTNSFAELQNPEPNQRHASLQTVFDHSWALLSADLQQILAACVLFQGDFSLQSALAVTGGSAEQLLYLVQHSLVQQVAPARFDLHPIIAEFAAHKLDLSGQRANAEHHYLAHYLRFAAQQQLALFKLATRTPVDLLQRELKHIYHAWQLAIQFGNFTLIANAIETLYLFFTRAFGQFQTFTTLVEQIEASAAPATLRHIAAIYKAHALVLNGQGAVGIDMIRDVLRNETTPRNRARAYSMWGIVLSYEGEIQAAQPRLAQAWEYAQDDDEMVHERVEILRHLIYANRVVGGGKYGSPPYGSAEKLALHGLALAQSGDYRYLELMMRYDIMRDHLTHYRYDRVLAFSTSLLTHATELQLIKSEVDWLSTLAHCYRVQGEHQHALQTLLRCHEILAANTLGAAYEIYIGQYYVLDLITHGDLTKAAQFGNRLTKNAHGSEGYIWEVAHLSAFRAHLAHQNVNAAQSALDQLRARRPHSHTNQIYFQQAELEFGLLTDSLTVELVETFIQQLKTFAGYITMQLYKTLVDALEQLQDQRATTYTQLAHEILEQRAAGIADPTFRAKYLAHQRQLLS